jgi:hypothetical protein
LAVITAVATIAVANVRAGAVESLRVDSLENYLKKERHDYLITHLLSDLLPIKYANTVIWHRSESINKINQEIVSQQQQIVSKQRRSSN